MKKKFLITLMIAVLTVVLSFAALSGCTFIRLNEEREANQILQTVSKYDKTLYTTQSELIDYVNSNASSLINNYQYSVEEAIRYLSDRKAETKLLTIEGIQYLQTEENAARKRRDFLVSGTNTIADGTLTWGEYYAAVKSVNDSLKSTADGYVDDYEADKRRKEVNKAPTKDVEKIEFTGEGLKKEYLKGDELDTAKLKIRITYLPETEGAAGKTFEIPVTDAMITMAFDSSAVAEEKSLVVTFTVNNKVKNDDGEYEYQAQDLTAEWKYEVKKAPTTRTKTEDEKEDTVVARYGTIDEIKTGYADEDLDLDDGYIATFMKDGLPAKIDLDAKIASSGDAEKDAYRQIKSNFESAYRNADYFYDSALENQVLAALQWELQQLALEGKDDAYFTAEIGRQFEFLSESSYLNYDGMSRKEQKEAFITAIGSALTSLYYIPKVYDANGAENLEDYAWVSQILFSFSDAEKEQLKAWGGSKPTDAAYQLIAQHMTVDEANPEYEPNHEHKDGKCEKNEDGSFHCNKDVPYLNKDLKVFQDTVDGDGNVTLSVYSRLCLDLKAAADGGDDVLKVFEDYLYRFNSDDGIFNNDLGYLITPDGEKSSWVENFKKLGRDLVQNSKDTDGLPAVGYYFDGKSDAAKQWTYKTDSGTATVPKVAFCFSEYGVHLMMIKFTPFNEIVKNKDRYAFEGGYRLTVETPLTDKNRETGKASETNFQKTLRTNIETEIKNEAYNAFIETYITDENKESAETTIDINEKKLDQLIKKFVG